LRRTCAAIVSNIANLMLRLQEMQIPGKQQKIHESDSVDPPDFEFVAKLHHG